MKILNNISRSQAVYRHANIAADDLQSGHYAYLLAIGREPGRAQEDLAQELCVNKSTVARHVQYLEEKGYVLRCPSAQDKRQFALLLTEKARRILPEIRDVSARWMALLSQGIPKEELDIFDAVLRQMQEKAREILEKQEADK